MKIGEVGLLTNDVADVNKRLVYLLLHIKNCCYKMIMSYYEKSRKE